MVRVKLYYLDMIKLKCYMYLFGMEGRGVSEDLMCNSFKLEYRYVIFNFLCMINGCNLYVCIS